MGRNYTHFSETWKGGSKWRPSPGCFESELTEAGNQQPKNDVKWKDFPCYWTIVRGIHRSVTVRLPSQKLVTQSFDAFFLFAWTNGSANNQDARDLRSHHYDVTVMELITVLVDGPQTTFRTDSLLVIFFFVCEILTKRYKADHK